MKELTAFRKYLAEGEVKAYPDDDLEDRWDAGDYGHVEEEEWFDKADRGEVEYDGEHDEFDTSDMGEKYYPPSDSYEGFDGVYYYNTSGQQLRSPQEYDDSEEGYTPFGDVGKDDKENAEEFVDEGRGTSALEKYVKIN